MCDPVPPPSLYTSEPSPHLSPSVLHLPAPALDPMRTLRRMLRELQARPLRQDSPAGRAKAHRHHHPAKKFRQGFCPVETPLHNYQPICKLPNRIHLSEKETINLLDETNVKTIICICKFFHTFLFPFIYFSSKCCKQKGSKGNSFRDHPPESAAEPDENGRAVPIGTARHILPPERDHPSAGPSI